MLEFVAGGGSYTADGALRLPGVPRSRPASRCSWSAAAGRPCARSTAWSPPARGSRVVAPEVRPESSIRGVTVDPARRTRSDDVDGRQLVITATDDPQVNAAVAADAPGGGSSSTPPTTRRTARSSSRRSPVAGGWRWRSAAAAPARRWPSTCATGSPTRCSRPTSWPRRRSSPPSATRSTPRARSTEGLDWAGRLRRAARTDAATRTDDAASRSSRRRRSTGSTGAVA